MKLNLSPDTYVDPRFFDLERKQLFSTTWQLLGPSAKLSEPGDYISDDIAGMKVIAIKGEDGKLRGFRNVCRHRGAQLLQIGNGNCTSLRCPYHNWSYKTSGELRHAPWFGEDPEFNLCDWSLQAIDIEEWRGLIFVCIEPTCSLAEQLGATISEFEDIALEDYCCIHQERMMFDANWKIYTDNFVEGYHIPGIHPEFFTAINFELFETTAHDGIVKMTAPVERDLFYQGRWNWMWPNWTVSLFDGGMNTSRINPVSYNITELIYHFYFEDNTVAAADARAETISSNLDVIKQDFQICLETHNNYRSGSYQPGPLSPRHEQGVAYFQDRYVRHIKQ